MYGLLGSMGYIGYVLGGSRLYSLDVNDTIDPKERSVEITSSSE
jgi:hypothetical protein